MSVVVETYNNDGRLQYTAAQPPYVFKGRVEVGQNAGTLLSSQAVIEDFSAPQHNPRIEGFSVGVPAGTRVVAITGNKYPVGINMQSNTLYATGIASGSCSIFCFGDYSATPVTSGPVFDLFAPDGTLLFDLRARPMKVVGQGTSPIAVPSGRVWAALVANYDLYTVASGNNPRRYAYTYITGPGTNGTSVGLFAQNNEVRKDNSGAEDYPRRTGSFTAIDVTGL